MAGSLAARSGREIPARRSTFRTLHSSKPVAPAPRRGPAPAGVAAAAADRLLELGRRLPRRAARTT
ncbi:MAG: hypothetical protein ABR521_11210 [Gaiellaceae bacterium]